MDGDDDWLRRIQRCIDAAAAWERRTAEAESPEPGSRLAADDARNPTLPASAVAWSSIGSAVDHLGLASDALQREGGGRLRPSAFYTVCRGALVGASQAIWVLTGSREVRLRRVRLLELDERQKAAEFMKDYTRDPSFEGDTSAELVEKIEAKVDQYEVRARQLRADLKPQRGEGSVTSIMREAAELVTANHDDAWVARAVMFEWRAASADSHARLWQREVRPGSVIPLVGQGSAVRYTTATAESYGQSLGVATLTTSQAFRLWDEQRLDGGTTPT